MKLTKTSWLLLTLGILIVLSASLGMAYLQQSREQDRLNQELSAAKQLLTKVSANSSLEKFSSQQRELGSRLTQAKLQLETAKTNLCQLIESIEVTETLFEVAQTYKVAVVEIGSLGQTNKQVGGVNCNIFSLTAKVEGNVPDLINFIIQLGRKFPTGVVKSVVISVPQAVEEGKELEEPSANIILSIHSYAGD